MVLFYFALFFFIRFTKLSEVSEVYPDHEKAS